MTDKGCDGGSSMDQDLGIQVGQENPSMGDKARGLIQHLLDPKSGPSEFKVVYKLGFVHFIS